MSPQGMTAIQAGPVRWWWPLHTVPARIAQLSATMLLSALRTGPRDDNVNSPALLEALREELRRRVGRGEYFPTLTNQERSKWLQP